MSDLKLVFDPAGPGEGCRTHAILLEGGQNLCLILRVILSPVGAVRFADGGL